MTAIKKGPWVQLSNKSIYENPWIRVDHHEVLTPARTRGMYGCVHFKHRAIGIIPVDDEGNTFLVKQYRYVLGEETYEIPEGGAPADETPLFCAQRELEEETGLKAKFWKPLTRLHLSNCVTDEEAFLFLAKELSVGVQKLDDTESIEVIKLPLVEACAWAESGKITDALSVLGLNLARAHL